MTRTKLGLLGLCAVVVMGMMAMSASAAQGATLSWSILNEAKTTATELKAALKSERDTLYVILLAHLVSLSFEISCHNSALVGVNLEKGGKLTEGGKVLFEECEVWSLKANGELETLLVCNPHSAGKTAGTIETNEFKGELVLHTLAGGGTEVLTKIEPKTAEGAFATILTEKCPLPESIPVKGSLFLKDCEGLATTHKLKHLITVGPLTSLFVFNDNAEHLQTTIDGSIWLLLSGEHLNRDWSAMDA